LQQFTLSYRADAGWSAPLPAALDGPQTLVLAFAAPELAGDPRPFADLAQAFPRALRAGCSTSGEIAGAQVHDGSASVVVACFEHTRLRQTCVAIEAPAQSHAAGAALARELAGDDLRAVFVLCDGLGVNGTPLVAGLSQGLPAGVPISGGLAGDGSRFAGTWVLDHDTPRAQRVCAIGFYGERLRVGHGCGGGWSDFGPERRITRAHGNVLYELDGRPALDLYKIYLGERAQELPGAALLFPLAVRTAGHDGEPLVRTILAIDEAERSMTFAGDLPADGVARLMRANTDKLIGSAARAARQALANLPGAGDALELSVSCVGRRLVLGERTDEEVEAVLDDAPPGCAHVGFYSYGEISPSVAGGASDLHNQTMTVTVFCEA
jgi:hypothetical protein